MRNEKHFGYEVHEDYKQTEKKLTDEEFQGLCDSIESRGQLVPVALLDGKIIDGMQRIAACKKLGKIPLFADIDGVDGSEIWVDLNVRRKHLGPMEVMRFIKTQDRFKGKEIKAAKDLGVSATAAKRSSSVLKFGDERLEALVDSKVLPLHTANELVQRVHDRDRVSELLDSEDPKEAVDSELASLKRAREAASGSGKTLDDGEPKRARKNISTKGDGDKKPKPRRKKEPEVRPAEDFSFTPLSEEKSADLSVAEQVAGLLADIQRLIAKATDEERQESYVRAREMGCILKGDETIEKTPRPKTPEPEPNMVAPDGCDEEFDPKTSPISGRHKDDSGVIDAWSEWCDYLGERGVPLNGERASEHWRIIKHKQTPEKAIACLAKAMDSGKLEPVKNPVVTNTSFVPPTIEELEEYAQEKSMEGFDSQEFIDFYGSKNWMVGSTKMSDWRSAAGRAYRNGWASKDGDKAKKDYGTKRVADWQYSITGEQISERLSTRRTTRRKEASNR